MKKENTIEQKKSSVDLTDLAIGIVILGIVTAIGGTVLLTMRNTQVTNAPVYTVANETITSVDAAGEFLSKAWVKSIDTITNQTTGTLINSGNFTTTISDAGVGRVVSTTSGLFNNTNWNVTYQVYNISDPRYLVPDKASMGLSEYGNWFKIMAIIGSAAVVLAILFMAFGNRSGSDGGAVSY